MQNVLPPSIPAAERRGTLCRNGYLLNPDRLDRAYYGEDLVSALLPLWYL